MISRLRGLITGEVGERCVSLLPAFVVLVCALFYVLAFVSMYTGEHVYERSSRWIYDNIPEGSTVTGVHWDDRLPLSLPGLSAHRYKFEGEDQTLNLYEPDSPQKISQTLDRIVGSDYIVFPTYRLPGSVPRIPEEYPWTTAFLENLFAEKLGFQLVKTFKDRPTLFGVSYDDDLADESFTVYDHPKVAVFKNVKRLSFLELDTLLNEFAPRGQMSLAEMMTKNSGDDRSQKSGPSSLKAVVLWFITIQVLAFCCLSLMVIVCQKLPDAGYGLSKVGGIFIFGLLNWWCAVSGAIDFSVALTRYLFAIIVIATVVALRRNSSLRTRVSSAIKSNWLLVEGVFFGVAFLFLAIRFLNSEIFWGEKPMDSTFLRFLTRADHLPPQDPWAAGQQMQYYYVGIAFFASLLKLTGIDPAIGYNLAVATLAGLIAASVVSVAMAVTRSRVWAAVSAVLVVCVSNLETIRVWISESERSYNFDSFWKTARVFSSPAFGEYTFWSLIFADFHAHVIAVPFTALLLGLLGTLWLQGGDRFGWSGIGARLGIGFLLGFLYAANTWDLISYGAIAGLLVLLSPIRRFWQPPVDSNGRTPIGERVLAYAVSKGSALAWDGILIGGAAVSVMFPFAMQSASTRPIGWGWVQSFELNTLKQVLLFTGHWLLVIIVSSGCIILSSYRRLLTIRALCTSLTLALFPFVLGLLATWNGIEALPWGIITIAALLIWLGVALAFVDPEDGWIGILVAGVGLTLVTAELLFLLDRMNTIFKSYMCVTLVSGISAVVLWMRAANIIRRSGVFQGFAFEMRLGLHSANFICVALPLIGSFLNAKGIISMQRIPERAYSLDGFAYYQRVNPEEYRLINWMNKNILGTPVTLEAQGDSYQDFTRIAMHTGLPTVLGWDHHVGQRGTPGASIEQRRRDIRNIYSTTDIETAQKLLIEYNVDLIIVGKQERRTYPEFGLEKFDQFPERFPVLFQDGSTTLYATQHSVWNPRRGSRARSIIER